MNEMFDSNFDPYQELIDLRIELEVIRLNFQSMVHAHNKLNHENRRLRKWLVEQQEELYKLRHNVDVINDRN